MSASSLPQFDVSAFLDSLRRAGCGLGEPFHYFTTTTSTSDQAKRLADDRAPHGTTCFADFQTHGRGRQGKMWLAQPNAQILASILLREPSLTNDATITLAVGVALHRALQSILPEERTLRIKWPNDIEARGRKLAGILTESHMSSGGTTTVIGFGLNIMDPTLTGPEPMQPISLHTLDCTVGREQLLVALLLAIDEALMSFRRLGLKPFVSYLNQYDALLGTTVTIDGVKGQAMGISDDGGLLLDTPNGPRSVYSGTLQRSQATSD